MIREISKVAKRVFPHQEGEVYLFGSRARGEADEFSDWDILILTREPVVTDEQFENLISPFSEIGWYTGEELNPINYSMDEWSQRRDTLFYQNVMEDAIKLK